MRPSFHFPEGFGFDPTMMPGTPDAGIANDEPQQRDDMRLAMAFGPLHMSQASYVPGPFAPPSCRGDAGDATPVVRHAPLLADGVHFNRHVDLDEPEDSRRIEPQSVVVTTALVGILLAAMGYFLDLR